MVETAAGPEEETLVIVLGTEVVTVTTGAEDVELIDPIAFNVLEDSVVVVID